MHVLEIEGVTRKLREATVSLFILGSCMAMFVSTSIHCEDREARAVFI